MECPWVRVSGSLNQRAQEEARLREIRLVVSALAVLEGQQFQLEFKAPAIKFTKHRAVSRRSVKWEAVAFLG